MTKTNTYLFLIIIILTSFYFFISPQEKEIINHNDIEKKEEHTLLINVLDNNNEVKSIELEEYIIGVVAAEMPASFHDEALKAQAIAARSYALYKINNSNKEYDVTTDVTTQSYITLDQMETKWGEDFQYYYDKIKTAVNETKNTVMKNNEEVICAFYFAMSNGYTQDSVTVFNQNLNYISSVESVLDINVKNYEVITTFTKEEFCNKLSISCNEITISNIKKSSTNHLEEIKINSKTFTGLELRSLLSLRSTDITIEINEVVNITTKGYGHGVGMSQYGANELAKIGNDYKKILNYYYQNIQITNI